MPRSLDTPYGHVWTLPMLQRQLRGVEPLVIRLWPPRDDSSALWRSTREISDAVRGSCRNYPGDVGGRSARRRASCARHGSRVDCLCAGLDGCLRVVLAGGKTDCHARRDWPRHHGLVAALSYESLTYHSWPLLARGMDRPGHLACPRGHPPSRPPFCHAIEASFGPSPSDSNSCVLQRVPVRNNVRPEEEPGNLQMCLDVDRYPPSFFITWCVGGNNR